MNSTTVGYAARLGIRLAIVLGLGLLWARAPLAEGTPDPRSDQTVLRDLMWRCRKPGACALWGPDLSYATGLIRTVMAKTEKNKRQELAKALLGVENLGTASGPLTGITTLDADKIARFPYKEYFRLKRASFKNDDDLAMALSAAAIALAWPAASSDLERIRQQDLKTLNAIARDFAHASAEYGILAENFRGWTVIEETQKKLKGTWTWHRWRNLIVPEMLVADFDNPHWLHAIDNDKDSKSKDAELMIKDWADTNLKTWCEPIDVESGKEKWTLDGIKGATPSDRRAGALNGLCFPLDGLNHPPLLVHPAVHRWATELKNQNISSDSRDGLCKWIFEQSLGSPIACAWLQKENRANENVAKLCLFARARGHFAGASVAPEVEKVLKDAKLEGQSYEQTLARWSNAAQRGYFERYPTKVDKTFLRERTDEGKKQGTAPNYGLLSYQGPSKDALQQERSAANTLVGDVWAKLPAELAKLDRVLTTQAGQIEFVLKWLEVGPTGNPEADVLIAERLAAIGDGVFFTKDVRDELYKVMHARTEGWLAEKILKEWAKLDALEFLAERAPEGLWDLYPKTKEGAKWVADGSTDSQLFRDIQQLENLYRVAIRRGRIEPGEENAMTLAVVLAAIESGSKGNVMQSRAAMIVATHAVFAFSSYAHVITCDTFSTLVNHAAKQLKEEKNSSGTCPLPLNYLLAHLAAYLNQYHQLGHGTITVATVITRTAEDHDEAGFPSEKAATSDNHRAFSRCLDYLTRHIVGERPLKQLAWSSREQVLSLVMALLYLRKEETLRLEMILSSPFKDTWHKDAMEVGATVKQSGELPKLHICDVHYSKQNSKVDLPSFAEALLWKQLVWLKAAHNSLLRSRAGETLVTPASRHTLRVDILGELLDEARFSDSKLLFRLGTPANDNKEPWENHSSKNRKKWARDFFDVKGATSGLGLWNTNSAQFSVAQNGRTPTDRDIVGGYLAAQLRLQVAPSHALAAAREAEVEAAQAELQAAVSAHAAALLEQAALKSIAEAFGSEAEAAELMVKLQSKHKDAAALKTDIERLKKDMATAKQQGANAQRETLEKGLAAVLELYEVRQAEYAGAEALLRTLERTLLSTDTEDSIMARVTKEAFVRINKQQESIKQAEDNSKRNWFANIIKSLVKVVCTVVGTVFGMPMLGGAIGDVLGGLIGGIIKGESFEKIMVNAVSGGIGVAAAAGVNLGELFNKTVGRQFDAAGLQSVATDLNGKFDDVKRALPDVTLGTQWIADIKKLCEDDSGQKSAYKNLVKGTLDTLEDAGFEFLAKLTDLPSQLQTKLENSNRRDILVKLLKESGISIENNALDNNVAAEIVSKLFVANLPVGFVQSRVQFEWSEFLTKLKNDESKWDHNLQETVRTKLKGLYRIEETSAAMNEMLVQARMCLDTQLGVTEVAEAVNKWSKVFNLKMMEVQTDVSEEDFDSANKKLDNVRTWVQWVQRPQNGETGGEDGWRDLTEAVNKAKNDVKEKRSKLLVESQNLALWQSRVQAAQTDADLANFNVDIAKLAEAKALLDRDAAEISVSIAGFQQRAARLKEQAALTRAQAGAEVASEREHRVEAARRRYEAAISYRDAANKHKDAATKEQDGLNALQALVLAIKHSELTQAREALRKNRRAFFDGQKAYLLRRLGRTDEAAALQKQRLPSASSDPPPP